MGFFSMKEGAKHQSAGCVCSSNRLLKKRGLEQSSLSTVVVCVPEL